MQNLISLVTISENEKISDDEWNKIFNKKAAENLIESKLLKIKDL